ncbi:MAG: bifunctional 4-hydroxy-2-oxoglutarate aldolase/2-dehydro-3-deoxy-phosphogluconate aldolase [Christensenellales bacterium]|nr:bifunctional 4-hydroxy-2-oxoglutarate aldolase/2-dehydro-3-deoxy-phosphogluconate aldolase [Clostridia bacterium]HRU83914.1 bifunctional 4-hydroxy-2-oxoglutarate aldolase/2-dehydro-3-deoxy-phosphogluconate aldolase [Eubacteriales bacterium]
MEKAIKKIGEEKIVPVLVFENESEALPTLEAIFSGGIGVAEITMRTKAAAAAIEKAARAFPDMLIGAGTVTTKEAAKNALAAGAKFLVSPGFSLSVFEEAKRNGVLYIPGCLTPTEIGAAVELGLSVLKFFPAEAFGGIKTLKAFASVFPFVRFMPTGGIGFSNLTEYLSQKNVLACGGSFICERAKISENKFSEITELTKKTKELVKSL